MRWHPLMICFASIYNISLVGHINYYASHIHVSWSCLAKAPFVTIHTCTILKLLLAFQKRLIIKTGQLDSCPERNKYVLLILNEMLIREDLVYNKHSGEFIGFANLGKANSQLDAFKHAMLSDEPIKPSLVKTIIVFMVRDLFDKLQFVHAQFPHCQLRKDKHYQPFWEAVCLLETCGLKVIYVDNHFFHALLCSICSSQLIGS